MNRLLLCADDFGIAPGVDTGICRLVKAGRLSAVSCMVGGSSFQESSAQLRQDRDNIDIGLHLTLTDHQPLSAMSSIAVDGRLPRLGTLWRQALLGQLAVNEIEREILAQLDAFNSFFGRAPDFLDGHHHVHQIPYIRNVVIRMLKDRFAGTEFYLRTTAETLSTIARRRIGMGKALALALPGWQMKKLANRACIATNSGFSGIYDFSDQTSYRILFKKFILNGGDRMLVMCHPGYSDDQLTAIDSVTTQRENELAYFESDDFLMDLSQSNFCLGRFRSDFQGPPT
jgi:predicted glycoside hydrolase/deacetylase ChbG (UPF0249 family)